jgi:hypothetical protein
MSNALVSGVTEKQIRRLLRTVNFQIRKSIETDYLAYKTCVLNYHEKIEGCLTYNKRSIETGKFQVIPLRLTEFDDSGKSDSENDQIGDQVLFMKMQKLKLTGKSTINVTLSGDQQVCQKWRASLKKAQTAQTTLPPHIMLRD